MLRVVEGRPTDLRGEPGPARGRLEQAVAGAEVDGHQFVVMTALVFLADAQLACGDGATARTALARARDFVTENAPVVASAPALLEQAERRIGRSAVRAARRSGVLLDPLTDRELSILRMIPAAATQREIAAALHLSINTVKAYAKSLYRKLGAASRADAVGTGRAAGVI